MVTLEKLTRRNNLKKELEEGIWKWKFKKTL